MCIGKCFTSEYRTKHDYTQMSCASQSSTLTRASALTTACAVGGVALQVVEILAWTTHDFSFFPFIHTAHVIWLHQMKFDCRITRNSAEKTLPNCAFGTANALNWLMSSWGSSRVVIHILISVDSAVLRTARRTLTPTHLAAILHPSKFFRRSSLHNAVTCVLA